MRSTFSFVVAALVALSAVPQSASAFNFKDSRRPIQVGESVRTYELHVPKKMPKSAMPLMIVLHGALGSGKTAKTDCRLSQRADKLGFIVVYPDGTPELGNDFRTWNAGGCCGTALKNNVDDVRFIRELITQVRSDYNIDERRIYLVGLSNGGMLAYRVASEMSGTVAAVASVEGSLVTPLTPPSSPVSVIDFHGTKDTVLPYNGGTGALLWHKVTCLPVSNAIDFWVQQDGCCTTPETSQVDDLTRQTYTNGARGTEVCLYTFTGGHVWPVVQTNLPFLHPHQLHWSMPDVICDFLLSHPKTTE